MEYSVKELAVLAGVSTRTLRYYDEIGLLRPMRSDTNRYRIYGKNEVDALQQILFYRELGIELEQIKYYMEDSGFDKQKAMEQHLKTLKQKRAQLDLLIQNASHTIQHWEGERKMSDHEKFEGLKKELIIKNEEKYGREIRKKYGEKRVEDANAKVLNLTEEEYRRWKELEQEVLKVLKLAYQEGNPDGILAHRACELHREWLSYSGVPYSKEYHKGLGMMYAEDKRFGAYYEAAGDGAAKFFLEAISRYCK